MLNSGSIRVDEMLSGNLTQYDIIRILPYPSKILEVEMNWYKPIETIPLR